MTKTYIFLLIALCLSCKGKNTSSDKNQDSVALKILMPEFQEILDAAALSGSILIYDLNEDRYYSNDFEWAKTGVLPASTFKITNSIIALETGVVENDSTLFKWNGEERYQEVWEQDLILKEAFHYSCVPCYQQIARAIGAAPMNAFLEKLDYGSMKVDSATIDLFWLEGASRISQLEQIDFLKRLYQSELSISERTENIMKRMMVIEDDGNYKLSGKTGWSTGNGRNNGWFVGYIETSYKTYLFATNIEPKPEFDMDLFPEIRKKVTLQAFEQLEI